MANNRLNQIRASGNLADSGEISKKSKKVTSRVFIKGVFLNLEIKNSLSAFLADARGSKD